MKATVILLATVASLASATPHGNNHGHQHHHLRNRQYATTETTVVSGPTVIAYVLNGQPISEADVMEGIQNGTLVWANGAPAVAPAYAAPQTSSPSSSSTWSAPTSSSAPQSSPPPSPSWSPSPSPPSSPSSTPSSSWGNSGGSGGPTDSNFVSDTSTGINTPFPDGELDCSTFPSDYGAVPVSYLGLGGWTGIQSPGSTVGGFGNIMTLTTGQCSDGENCCGESMFCSYACPNGWQKGQWPSTQGSSGQSVGGLQCVNGKLQLTNTNFDTLCIQGASEVNVQIQNELGQQVSVCRTDYPGTESETIPLNSQPGSTTPLTCPDADNYYDWEGSHTSAQYYVNPAGVSVEDGCQWGSSANPFGNFAPLNLGVGYSNGAAWLSIFQNLPTTSAQLDFSVEIQGDGLSGTCRYSNGMYCGGDDYSECSSTTGCTVSLSSGTATFVFSN